MKKVVLGGAALVSMVSAASAFAGNGAVQTCSADSGTYYKALGTYESACGDMAGVNQAGGGVFVTGDTSTWQDVIAVGGGQVAIYAADKISMNQYLDMTGHKISGVTNGEISATSTEAINGSQLYETNQKVEKNTADIGKNTADIATLNTNVAQNTADIAKNTSDIATLNTNVAQNTSDITNINNQLASGNIGLVKQDGSTRNITVAKDNDGKVVDMTGTEGTRTVTGVSAGALTADSTDAVNGSQLYQTNLNVESLSQQVANFSSMGSSSLASQNNDTPAVASGANSSAIGNGSKATGKNSVAIGSGSVADEDNTVSIGSVGNERRVTNVAPGVKGTDAVNMNQLNAVQSSVNAVARSAFAGVASAMAMPNLTPSQPGKTVVAAGVANYKGYTAVGVGGTYRSRNNHWLVNAAASVTPSGDTGVRGQVGYEF
ncbi:YadA domain-containing protein [Caballeronia hypogeia]|uniref:YadA domain-containing protein n=3 Tax=Caballeronia hypogeia TaxID=1777140 RepID=A0A157Z090_9BURK|nr:YadA domain-containing protein [Caballeronia hypogeia]